MDAKILNNTPVLKKDISFFYFLKKLHGKITLFIYLKYKGLD